MTRARKRALAAALSLTMVGLVAGTASSSKTSRYRHRHGHQAKKNHSTTVKTKTPEGKNQKGTSSQQVIQKLASESRQQNAWEPWSRFLNVFRSYRQVGPPAPPRRITPSQTEPQIAATPPVIPTLPQTQVKNAPVSKAAKRAAARRQAWLARSRRDAKLAQLKSGPIETQHESNEDLIQVALASRGIPYRWGGTTRRGFDCSGFTRYVYLTQRGIELPHSASGQARYGQRVAREALQPGDLVFFQTYRRSISHVGIYIGDNKFVHAANSRSDVRVDTLASGYYERRYVTGRRLTLTSAQAPQVPADGKTVDTSATLVEPAGAPAAPANGAPDQPAQETPTDNRRASTRGPAREPNKSAPRGS